MKKLFCIFLLLSIFIVGNLFALDIITNRKINLVEVYVANRDIGPRETITINDIKSITIPKNYVLENAINNKNEIIGKITTLQGLIPKDSLFYKSQLEKFETLPDAAVSLLDKNQVAFILTNETGGLDLSSFTVGQRIDIYVSIEQRNVDPIFDLLLESVRVVSIKDRKGIEISEESSGSPFSLTFAIENEYISLLSIARKIGTLELYATNKSYDKKETKLNQESKILEYIKQP